MSWNQHENVQKLTTNRPRNQSQQIPENQNHVGPVGRLQKETNNNNKTNSLHVEM